MFLKKEKTLIYIVLFVITSIFILPVYCFAVDKDSIYVWSNNSSSIPTATTIQKEPKSTTQDNSR